MKLILSFIIFFLYCNLSFAKIYVFTDTNSADISLNKYLEYYEDLDNSIDIYNFINRSERALTPIKKSFWSNHNCWFRLIIDNKSKATPVFFVVKAPYLDYIDFYYRDSNNNLVAYHTGDRLPFTMRPITYDQNFTFPIELKNGKNEYYIMVKSSSPIRVPLHICSHENYIKYQINSSLIIGSFLGFILLLCIFFLLLTIYSRFKIFLFLFFSMLLEFYYITQSYGLSFKYIFNNHPLLDEYSCLLTLLFGAISTLVVVDCFHIDERHPLKKIFKIFIKVSIILFILCIPALFFMSFSQIKAIIYFMFSGSYLIGCLFLLIIFTFKKPYTLAMIGYHMALFSIWSEEIIESIVINANINFCLINFIPPCISIIAVTFWGIGIVHAISIYLSNQNVSIKDLKKALRKSTEVEEKFVTILCHELGTPVQSAQYSINKLYRLSTNYEMKKVIDKLNISIQKLSYLINNFIKKFQSDNYKIVLKYETVEIKYLIKKVLSILAPFINEKNHTISFEIDSNESFLVQVDRNLIEQVMLNIILNAIKYTHSSGTIIIKLVKQPNSILIHVIDNGYGIKSSHSDNIFVAFYRSDFIKNRADGLGIGLTISQKIIQEHHGNITYISPLPKEYDYLKNNDVQRIGTIFTIYLPTTLTPKENEIEK